MLVAAEAFWSIRDVGLLFERSLGGTIIVAGDFQKWHFLVLRRCRMEGLTCRWEKDRLAWIVEKPPTDKIAG